MTQQLQNRMPNPKVLIVADNASAAFGGEAALPLHYFRVLRGRGIHVELVTHARVQDELLRLFPESASSFHFIPDRAMHRWICRLSKPLPARVEAFTTGYVLRLLTQFEQRRIARRLVREGRVDVIHQPSPVSPKEPSLLFNMGVPVVIGPMNGGMDFPPGFRTKQSAFVSLTLRVARLASHGLNRFIPGKLRAAALLVANERTRLALPWGVHVPVITMVENGVDLTLWQPPSLRTRAANAPMRIAFLGRLVDWKAVDLLIHAFAQACKSNAISLTLIGDGPQRQHLEPLAAGLGLLSESAYATGKIHFAGWQAQPVAAKLLAQHDCLALPSLMECGGAVVLEAMSLAMPVIASDWGGPADYLDASCGILVMPRSRDTFIADLAQALSNLAADPVLRARLGAAGRQKVERQFDWEHKVNDMMRVYQNAIGREIQMPRLASSD